MSNTEVPNLLKKRFDLKTLTIGTFLGIIENVRNAEKVSQNTEVICYTNFGTITGKLLPNQDDDNENYGFPFFHDQIMKIRNNEINQYESEGTTKIINDTVGIPLIDVEINYYADPDRTDKLAYFLLFPDQVAGIAFGERVVD